MTSLFSKWAPSLLIAIGAAIAPCTATAALVPSFANGGFEGYTGNKNTFNGETPPGWTTTAGTPDTFNANTTMNSFKWTPSSTGGDFLHGIGWDRRPGSPYVESALQVGLTGLVVGQKYEVSFEQTISNSVFSEGGGYWQVIFGTESHNSADLVMPARGVAAPWQWQTLIFTATDIVQTLEVVAHSTTGIRADLGIDSFFLGDPGTNPDNPTTTPPNSVPEPGSLPLLALTLAGLAAFARRRPGGAAVCGSA